MKMVKLIKINIELYDAFHDRKYNSVYICSHCFSTIMALSFHCDVNACLVVWPKNWTVFSSAGETWEISSRWGRQDGLHQWYLLYLTGILYS